MFLVSGVDLVMGACRAGIIGAMPTQNCRTTEQLAAWLTQIDEQRASSSVPLAPWAANLIVHSSNTRLPEDLALLVQHKAPLVITALGSPRGVVDAVHAYGGLVFGDVGTPAQALKAAEAGVDGLVLVSSGAGGHAGPLAMPAFIGEVRERWSGPLMVAGAIANGAAVRGAQIMGADLVYIGTPFIACTESLAPLAYKDMVTTCTSKDIMLSNAFTGAHANYMRPSIVAAGLDPDALVPKGSIDATKAQDETRAWKNVWSAGQAVGQVKAVEPIAVKVDRLAAEYAAAVRAELADPWLARFSSSATPLGAAS